MKRTQIYTMLLIAFLACVVECMAGEPVDSAAVDSVHERMSYPRRLLHDFPVIYADTAYSTEDYSVVLRAVWMSHGKKKCRLTSSELLPYNEESEMVKFGKFIYQDTMISHTDATVMNRK
ncbi:MAG: hypothetical protein NC082_07445 [Clostridiales bacterium]|nr:hypothetical protein [Clostridiales bacterium]